MYAKKKGLLRARSSILTTTGRCAHRQDWGRIAGIWAVTPNATSREGFTDQRLTSSENGNAYFNAYVRAGGLARRLPHKIVAGGEEIKMM
jgi:hypothetical protein